MASSGKAEGSQDAARLSSLFPGVVWARHFPLRFPDGSRIECEDFDAVLPFIAAHQARAFGRDAGRGRFDVEPFDERKRLWLRFACDCFVFIGSAGEPFGIFIGNPVDWSTYCFRSVFVLPEHQGGGHYQRLLAHLIEVLRACGVARVEADVSPSNQVSTHILTKLGFKVTGTTLGERWGALVRFTLHLDERAESIFLDSFCDGPRPQPRKIPTKGDSP